MKRFITILFLLGGCAMAETKTDPTEFDKLWNFNDPASTEVKFREILPGSDGAGLRGAGIICILLYTIAYISIR